MASKSLTRDHSLKKNHHHLLQSTAAAKKILGSSRNTTDLGQPRITLRNLAHLRNQDLVQPPASLAIQAVPAGQAIQKIRAYLLGHITRAKARAKALAKARGRVQDIVLVVAERVHKKDPDIVLVAALVTVLAILAKTSQFFA